MNTSVHFSSATDMWETPFDLFQELDREFRLDIDVCATKENKKCRWFFSKEEDGLAQDWSGLRCWMNPPYGREIGKWVQKAATGGGGNCCGLTSRAHRHALVARLDSRQSRSPFYQRTTQVWWAQKQRTVPLSNCDL